MSIGFLVPEEKPVVWRGPMVSGLIKQFLYDVQWGDLDYLIVDLPPGTGDAQLTLAQLVPMTGAIVTVTPQPVAVHDAVKGMLMFKQLEVPILGIVENMSYFICPCGCNHRTDIFGHGGARKIAEEYEVRFLGEVPLDASIRTGGDSGRPIMIAAAHVNPIAIDPAVVDPESPERTADRPADPELPPKGAALASRLIAEWAGGVVLAGAVDVGEAPARRWRSVRPARASAVLGDAVSDGDVREVFEQLGLRVGQPNGEVQVEIPGYRVDLDREVDLIEEIARVRGYDRLDSTLPGIKQPGGMAPTYALRRTVREALVRAGLREAISLSFASAGDLALMGHGDGLRVANPISAEEALLRTSLVPALLGAARRNVARGVRGVSLFEVGHVFLHGDPVDERESAAGLLTGPANGSVMDPERAFDFFDAKGALEALMKGLGVRDWRTGAALPGPYHPARSAGVIAGGDLIGAVGEVHPRVAERFDLPDPVAIFEVDVSSLGRRFSRPVLYRDVPRFPAVHRDLAFVMDEAVPAGTVLETLGEAGGGRVGAVRLFDVFSGSPIPQGRKSLGFSVEFRAPDRTLTDEEADEAVGAIVARLAVEFGAELRSG
jgi:phenylalanyl-tRNA synthetase beta chain